WLTASPAPSSGPTSQAPCRSLGRSGATGSPSSSRTAADRQPLRGTGLSLTACPTRRGGRVEWRAGRPRCRAVLASASADDLLQGQEDRPERTEPSRGPGD